MRESSRLQPDGWPGDRTREAAEPLPKAGMRRPRTAVLVGPGVVGSGNVHGLRAFAAMTGLAVVNTFSKGVFRWDDLRAGWYSGGDDWHA